MRTGIIIMWLNDRLVNRYFGALKWKWNYFILVFFSLCSFASLRLWFRSSVDFWLADWFLKSSCMQIASPGLAVSLVACIECRVHRVRLSGLAGRMQLIIKIYAYAGRCVYMARQLDIEIERAREKKKTIIWIEQRRLAQIHRNHNGQGGCVHGDDEKPNLKRIGQ